MSLDTCLILLESSETCMIKLSARPGSKTWKIAKVVKQGDIFLLKSEIQHKDILVFEADH